MERPLSPFMFPAWYRFQITSVLSILLLFGATVGTAKAQKAGSLAATSALHSTLSPVDYNFVAQANLGAPFQVDSGRLAEKKATTADLRDYAHLMVVTHIPVIDDLNAILPVRMYSDRQKTTTVHSRSCARLLSSVSTTSIPTISMART